MTNPEYGTPEYYAAHFSDILGDVATEQSAAGNSRAVINIIRGFQMAIESWLEYHEAAVTSYKQLRDGLIEEDLALKAYEEEMALPPIPPIPSILKQYILRELSNGLDTGADGEVWAFSV